LCPLSRFCAPCSSSLQKIHTYLGSTHPNTESFTSFEVRLITVPPMGSATLLLPFVGYPYFFWRMLTHFLVCFMHPPWVNHLIARIPRNVALIVEVIIIFTYLRHRLTAALGVYTECYLLSSSCRQTRKNGFRKAIRRVHFQHFGQYQLFRNKEIVSNCPR